MPELTPQERLQPALLDRLTDEEPGNTQEPRERRVVNKTRLRQAVLRDLAWLFNATRLESNEDLASVPHVRRSVVFEPRILPNTLQVRALLATASIDHHNVIGVEIRCDLWAQPVPLELLMRTEIDLETGKVEIADLAASRAR